MGMFDYITYNGNKYQTKDTPAQYMDNYEIRNNQLWHENYDAEWIDPEEGSEFGHIEKRNLRWVFREKFIGEIRFYRLLDKKTDTWEEYSSYFYKGQLKELHLLEKHENAQQPEF